MTIHLRRSRIAKALTDVPGGPDFEKAEAQLATIHVGVLLSPDLARTAAGQAAALTAIATAMKCFQQATLVLTEDVLLLRPLPIGKSLIEVAWALGASISTTPSPGMTHGIAIGLPAAMPIPDDQPAFVSCWWDGWLAGLSPGWDPRPCGRSANPLAGAFAGALAVREAFAALRKDPKAGRREVTVSLWEPWNPQADTGPDQVYMPDDLWLVGLGHLGQAFLWTLAFVPGAGRLVLQDDQTVNEENIDTGLINSLESLGRMKTRVAQHWIEAAGWSARLVERRFNDDLRPTEHEAPLLICGLDNVVPRMGLAKAGFAYMIDAGVGHGPVDFEGIQVRVLPQGSSPERYWTHPANDKDVDAVMRLPAYQEHERQHDGCGTFTLAEASVAVPFVGAATAALTIAQAMRLASLKPAMSLLQMELGAPAMTSFSDLHPRPEHGLGGFRVAV